MCCIRCVVPDVLCSMLHRCVVPDVVPDVLRSMLHRCVVPDVRPDVLYPMLYPMYCARFTPDVLRPVYARVCRGALPLFRHIAPTGRECNKTQSRGGPRVSFTPFTIPWAEIPLPLQGAAVSKPPNNYGALVFLNRAPRFQNLRIMNGSCVFKTSMFCPRVAPFNRQFYAMFRWF